jgi:phage FluMu gp28-like protein
MKTPLDILLPYQRDWVDDPARFKIGMWSRQTGKSFATAGEAVRDCSANANRTWVCMSAGERQALEWMEKAKQWTEAFETAISFDEVLRDNAQSLMRSAEIRYANGSRLIAIPANPKTARGYSANLVLDEFAFHEDPDAIWKAIYPSISNPLKGELKLRIVSTPNGRGNKFYDLWTKNQKYSHHLLTIYDAVKRGLPVDPEELKAAIDDAEAWAQEYLCEFIDASSILLPYDLIALCEVDAIPGDFGEKPKRYAGYDVGRHKDLAVYWELTELAGILWTSDLQVFEKTPYHQQFEFLSAKIPDLVRIAIDATGNGEMLAEESGRKYPGKVIEQKFTQQSKQTMYERMRRSFQDRTVRVPNARDVREDLHAVHKVSGNTGMVRYIAPSTAAGHSDRAAALALAQEAAATTGGPFEYESVGATAASDYDDYETGLRHLPLPKGVLL